ncbi:MAG: hypothetical protein JWO31_990 [Phycisphaerales bacterium]|nr:hypothetical protein [Phycisphaerales bacterium]
MTSGRPDATTKLRGRTRKVLRPLLLVLIALVLAASVACNVLLYRLADLSYRRLSEAQLDPYGLKHPDFAADAPAGRAGDGLPAVVFFGDSRAHG